MPQGCGSLQHRLHFIAVVFCLVIGCGRRTEKSVKCNILNTGDDLIQPLKN